MRSLAYAITFQERTNNISITKLDISELKLANVEIKYDNEKEEILISSKINPKWQ